MVIVYGIIRFCSVILITHGIIALIDMLSEVARLKRERDSLLKMSIEQRIKIETLGQHIKQLEKAKKCVCPICLKEFKRG